MSFPRPRSMTRVRYVVRVWTEWTTACPRRQRPQTHPLSDPSPRRGRPSEPRSPGCTHTLLRFFKRHSHLSQRRRQHFHWSINKDHPVLLYKNEPLATRRDISVMYSCLQEALSFILIKATLPPTPCYLCGGRVHSNTMLGDKVSWMCSVLVSLGRTVWPIWMIQMLRRQELSTTKSPVTAKSDGEFTELWSSRFVPRLWVRVFSQQFSRKTNLTYLGVSVVSFT